MSKARIVIILGLLLWLFGKPVYAHEWYPKECCGGQHCYPVPCNELLQLDNGNWQWKKYIFKKETVQSSHDAKCHVCIYTGLGLKSMPYCAFIPLST